ncbi:MAG: SRPBCC family protein [Chitinophagaceae bacterium]|nr:SRPBCC family protein [Chitinophagaceae bacterium]HQU56713.1 SRPBCC family protein [Chitinophagaceae bacterium]
MPTIHLTTFIAAPAEVVFDLSRHVGLHQKSMSAYKEEAVAGTQVGLMEKDETVTWKARHLFKNRILRVKICEMMKPQMFTDEQVQGDFKQMKHEHHFKTCENGTIMIDLFYFESPYGIFGHWFNTIYLTKYMRRLLEQRNKTIQEYAESGKWKKLLIK